MFKKCLVLVSLVALLFALPVWADGPDTVCGWIGPTNCSGDTGHIAVSDSHTQGEHSLNFVMHYVDNAFDSTYWDSASHAEFKKFFYGIAFPDSILIDIISDTTKTESYASLHLKISYKDSLWECCTRLGGYREVWKPIYLYRPRYGGKLIRPDTVFPSPPPSHIDTLIICLINYGWDFRNFEPIPPTIGMASISLDNLRFFYENIDTLIDGMGDKTGTEETTPIYKQKLEIHPNPCHSTIKISYCLPTSGHILFETFDITGSRIAILEEQKPAGKYKKIWNVRDERDKRLSSGIYFLRMMTNNSSITKKFILLP